MVFHRFLEFLTELKSRSIYYTLTVHRDPIEAIMVRISVPGERWEVEFFSDGSVEVEKFTSTGDIMDEMALQDLFKRFSN